MWAIRNETPYRAERAWGRDRNGLHEWIVAVKGTYDIKPSGEVSLASDQLDPLLVPEYHGDDGGTSLRYDADLVAAKPTTDVVINGTAYAPGGRPSSEFMVAARVGRILKKLRVIGDRSWEQGLAGIKPSGVKPVASVPILYEHAYGGYDHSAPDPSNHRMDSRNPVGCGVFARPENRVGHPLHNFEYLEGTVENAGPAGFGAIPCHWSPRRELSGTYDEGWERSRKPLLPVDWDPRSLLCAPADQRPSEHLRGGEPVELTNLTPSGRLNFFLPRVRLIFRTRVDGRIEDHSGQLATVIVEPDYPRVIMVWATVLACPTNIDYLEETIVREKEHI